MNETGPGPGAGDERRPQDWRATACAAADWLHLAAAPVFALMAWLAAAQGDKVHQMACLGMAEGSPWNSMSLMYLLMSVFHAAPWAGLAKRYSRNR